MDKNDHGQENARGWLGSIREMVAALQATEDGEQATIDGIEYDDADEVRERIEESVLSVSVRSGWYAPGDQEAAKPVEYEILLTTGGPALRITGELDAYGQPNNARLEYQNWGIPWTRFNIYAECDEDIKACSAAESDILTFAQCFYFGD